MGELSKLPNIGKTLEEQLNQVGISTEEQLKAEREGTVQCLLQ